MIEWDYVRYFLAVAREGSVRAASDRLGVKHSTVLRRIAQLEERLGARMFEKLPSGYRLTSAGKEILQFAEQMDASANRLETRVSGRDQTARGLLRVTLAPFLATHLLMPDFAEFAELHPEIEMEMMSIAGPVNLTNREADVAVRVVHEHDAPPLNLHAVKGPDLFGGVYVSRALHAAWLSGASHPKRWIVCSEHGVPDWARGSELRPTEAPFKTTDGETLIVAVRRGVGMSPLPCFVGDADPMLVRVPGIPLRKHGTLWLLTLAESHETRRVRLFMDLIGARLTEYAPLLAGRSPSRLRAPQP